MKNTNKTAIPAPVCHAGYPEDQLQEILGPRSQEFKWWMNGQTMSICTGQRYNHDTKEYEATGCGPHGPVVYSWDLRRWLEGLPVID